MAGPNYFDQFDHPAGTPGFVPLTGGNPRVPLDLQHLQGSNQLQSDELSRQGSLNASAAAAAADAAAKSKYADETYRAQRDKAVSDAHIAQANDPTNTTVATPNSDKQGEAYLQTLPPGMAPIVRSVLAGNLVVPGNAYKDGYWKQVLQHAVNADPDFNAADFNIRARTRQSFTSGPMATNITALNTALGHAGQLQSDVADLGNWGGWIGGNIVNPLRNWWEGNSNPAITNFQNDARAYGGEKTNVFANGGGGQGERKDAAESVPLNGTPDQQLGVLSHDASLFKSRIDALNTQYQRGMGKTADVTDLLDPHARAVYNHLLATIQATTPGSPGAANNPPPPGSPPPPTGGLPSGWTPPTAPAGGVELATSATHSVDDDQANAIINSMLRAGASNDRIYAAIAPFGFGQNAATDKQLQDARNYLIANPGYKGSVAGAHHDVPTTTWERIASSPVGTGTLAGIDSILGGTTDEISGVTNAIRTGQPISQAIADANTRKNLAFATNPTSAAVGGLVGSGLGVYGGTKLLGGLGVGGRVAPYLGAAAYGALSGAGQDNDNRLGGALLGGATGALGAGLGELAAVPLGAAARSIAGSRPGGALLGMFGRGIDVPTPLSPGQSAAVNAIGKLDPNSIKSALSEAQGLGVPMSLADTAPQLSSLAGAAVRRSPNAAAYAESQLLPRAAGQIDRFGNAVTRDLGPVANIPQASADLMSQARATAAPLYAQAYASPAVGSPELDSLLSTPAGRQALTRARTIAANERRDPQDLGFSLDDQGNVTLNPVRGDLYGAQAQARSELQDAQDALKAARAPGVDRDAAMARVQAARDGVRQADAALKASPSAGTAATSNQYTPQTLDYVKRGVDDVIGSLPKDLSGRPIMDENYRAVDGVRRQLLTELDKLNPAYGQARAAYAGPAASNEALGRGVDAASLTPDEVSMMIAGQSPEHLGQMQLGYRSQMMNRAEAIRDTHNPFEAVLGSPAARGRIDALYPDNPGNAQLFRQRDLEQQLARTNTDILGNSKTAQRGIADQAFTDSSLPAMAVDAALMAHGGVPVASIARGAARGKLSDIMKLGLGQRAVAKADQLAPILLNTDPAAASASIDDLIRQQMTYDAYKRSFRPSGPLGMFGSALGVSAATRP